MSQQKALFLTAKNGDWKVEERPIGKPGKGEVLIKIHSAALNPIDWKIQKFGRFVENFPAIVGSDAAGEIADVGEGVTTFKKGDKVLYEGWYSSNDFGTFQQYGLCPAELVSKIPDAISFDEASTVPLCLATALVGLYNPMGQNGIDLTPFWTPEGKDKYKNQSIVIFGGSSSVGQFVIQAAKLSGFNPIVTTSSIKHEKFLKELGATHVIDRSSPDVAGSIKSVLPEGSTGLVYDPITDESTQKAALAVTNTDAKVIYASGLQEGLDFGNRTVVRTFGALHQHRKIGGEIFQFLFEYLQDGRIKTNRPEVLKGGLGGIPDGLKRLEENKVSGVKLVAHPWE